MFWMRKQIVLSERGKEQMKESGLRKTLLKIEKDQGASQIRRVA